MTEQGLKQGIVLLSSSFPDRKFDARAMWLLLQDLTDVQFLRSVYEFCRTTTELYPGTNVAATLRRRALQPKALGAEAWGELMKQISSVGSYGEPKFSDPILTRTVEAMGWRSICTAEESSIPTIRAQFMKMYDALKERGYEEEASQSALQIGDVVKRLMGKAQTKALSGQG